MNGFKLWDPNTRVLPHMSQFAALKLWLEFQLHGCKVWCILVLEPFLHVHSIAVLVAVTVAAANQLEHCWKSYQLIGQVLQKPVCSCHESCFFLSHLAWLRSNFSESVGIGIVPSRISLNPLRLALVRNLTSQNIQSSCCLLKAITLRFFSLMRDMLSLVVVESVAAGQL